MKIEFDFSEVEELAEHFIKASAYFDRSKLSAVLRYAVKPVESTMRNMAPRSEKMIFPSSGQSSRFYHHKHNQARRRNTNRLRESIRIRTVSDREVTAKVIVGASKKKGQAGWRAHFSDRGWTTRNGRKIPGKHFSSAAASMVAHLVTQRFGEKASKDFGKAFGIIRSKKGRRSRKIAA